MSSEYIVSLALERRIETFVAWGDALEGLSDQELRPYLAQAELENAWFTEEYLRHALARVRAMLQREAIESWASAYDLAVGPASRVGLVMAANVPLVGFHDILCVLMSGQRAYLRPSARDTSLLGLMTDLLMRVSSEMSAYLRYCDRLKEIDALIATGRDETVSSLRRYFAHMPHLLRGSRSSCAILRGDESVSDLKKMAEDAFLYFGLGCRSINKVYLPFSYDLDRLVRIWQDTPVRRYSLSHHRYMNHYLYQRALRMASGGHYLDGGFFVFVEEKSISSPIGVLFYERYKDMRELKAQIDAQMGQLQCIYATDGCWPGAQQWGRAQSPALDDYADQVDTMAFLAQLARGPHLVSEDKPN